MQDDNDDNKEEFKDDCQYFFGEPARNINTLLGITETCHGGFLTEISRFFAAQKTSITAREDNRFVVLENSLDGIRHMLVDEKAGSAVTTYYDYEKQTLIRTQERWHPDFGALGDPVNLDLTDPDFTREEMLDMASNAFGTLHVLKAC